MPSEPSDSIGLPQAAIANWNKRVNWLAMAVGILSVSITGIAFITVDQSADDSDRQRFEQLANNVGVSFNARLVDTTQALRT
jgi:hypothetical protein